MIPLLEHLGYFPASVNALQEADGADGLLCASRSINPALLNAAYQRGIYPWYNERQPVLWWTPSRRMVLTCSQFKCSKSLRRTLRQWYSSGEYSIVIDRNFTQVLQHCANRKEGTWMTAELQAAYRDWHQQGSVHSIETYLHDRLIGGFYGVNLGTMFFGESMFALETDASKAALACFVHWWQTQGGDLIDCQQNTAHLSSLGAQEMPRAQFEQELAQRTPQKSPAWPTDIDLLAYWAVHHTPSRT